ncbi:hypothetical protein N657DRAFT_632921 [Parathielavia appendiculata]|uniref:Cenp-O kinetochore centromere component n=1 Tax=Parathielavia appendiculata TaxID=2587402 RepID=A0AAN6U2A9_9PEZI|nr:hypothetical protein N657DRAFT_632921 [Parathielavia appendiculata]
MASSLDDEIEALQARVSALKKQLSIHTSTLIAARSTRQLLAQEDNTAIDASLKQKLLTQSDLQQAHNQHCLYRACATLTTFRARDPDPHAVDGGAILGLRIEVTSRAKFLRPYYVLMNRPYVGARHLRVHRHTLPPCIPLAGLAARYLPPPSASSSSRSGGGGGGGDGGSKDTTTRQDLARFARALRREVVRYHHRLGVVADLRKAAGLGRKKDVDEGDDEGGVGQGSRPVQLVDIAPADAETKQITLEWADGRTGRLVMGDDGEIVKLVVLGENGRDREAGRDLLGGAVRVEEVVKRLAAMV